jgi:predicted amidohydrolase YtcJ
MSVCLTLFSMTVGAAPDLIIHNAAITDFQGNRYSAIAVDGERISALGTSNELLNTRDRDTRLVDAGGRRLIPGINDSHLHVVRGGRFYNLETRWDGIASLEEALALVARQAERTPEGAWVRVVGGWTPFQFQERRMPTVEELNAAAPDTPVFVLFLYSGALLNQAAMRALGIDEDSEAPPGSRFERDATGRPTGVLIADPNPAILYRTIARLPQLSAEQQISSTQHFYRRLLSLGVTSAVDAGGGGHRFPDDYAATTTLAERGALPLRISAYLFPQEPGREFEQFETWMESWERDRNLSDGGSYAVEGGGELLVWSASDYENFTADRPELALRAEEELESVIRLHLREAWPFRIHATYDESISRILDVLEAIHVDMPLNNVRWALDHAETISTANLRRVKALGGAIAVQGRMAFAGEYFVERYGAAQARRSPPMRRMLDMNIPVALGTDGTRVASFNPWDAYYWAVTGRTLGGLKLYEDDNTLDRLTALRLFTRGSAWLSGDESRKGSLQAGMLADLAILDRDILSVASEELRATQAVLTLVGGEIVYSDGQIARATAPLPPALPAWSPVNFP